MKPKHTKSVIYLSITLVLIAVSFLYHFRIDLTSDKRYSVSEPTKHLMSKVGEPLHITVYLDGDLNPGFLRLKKSIVELIDELSVYTPNAIDVRFENPSIAATSEERNKYYATLQARGLQPTAVYERDKEGKSIQKVLFPCVEISYKNRKVPVCLLKNIRGNSGEENLNISIENLEFEITDGIRQCVNTDVTKIAFLEGHGELNEAQTYDISKALSRYFQVDRGVITSNAAVLDNYKVVVIAKPSTPFSETEKYVIDQYIMHGGRVLWLIDGVRVAKQNLVTSGVSPAMELDLNLADQLFRYGVRINPVLLQDVQCASVPVNIAPRNTTPQFEPTPWFYAPLLLTSGNHSVTRNITEVRAEFCSGIDLVGDNKQVKPVMLLATSDNTHIVGTPTTIDLGQTPKATDKTYFNLGYVPVAVALEGVFESAFAHRGAPAGLTNTLPVKQQSLPTRQIVVACGDIIRNETNGIASDSTTAPLGFDRYMNQQFGNKEFVLNAVLYLADNDGWMQLRNRTLKLRLLNKEIITNDKTFWQTLNMTLPIALLLIFGIVYQWVRKRKYTKPPTPSK